MSKKFWNDFTIFDHPVCSNLNKVGHQIYYFMKGHYYILQDHFYLVIYYNKFKLLSMVTIMYIFWCYGHPI